MTSNRSCGWVILETAARKAAAAVEPFAEDTGGCQLDIPEQMRILQRCRTNAEGFSRRIGCSIIDGKQRTR